MSSEKKKQPSISSQQSSYYDSKNEKKSTQQPEKIEWQRSASMWDSANLISKLYCLYVFPFMYRNYKKDFDLSELSKHAKRDDCICLGERLKVNWNREANRQKVGKSASLVRALFCTFGTEFFYINCLCFFVFGVLRNIIPLVLGRVIMYSNLYFQEKVEQEIVESGALTISTLSGRNATAQNDETFLNLTYRQNFILFSGVLIILALLNILIPHPFFMTRYRLGMNFRAALTRLVYEKALRVSNSGVQRFTVGKIVNLISNDVNRFEVVFVNFDFSYLAIPYTAIAMGILYWYFGRASLGALAIALVYIPFQSLMANILSRFRNASIQLTDDRLRLMAEILPAMRVIKMYVWEVPFSMLVHTARKLEINKIRQSMMLRCVNLALFFVSSKVMAFVCILLFLLDGGELNAEIVFVSMSMFSQIRENMTYHFPFGTAIGIETYISIKRIEKFLLEDEVSNDRPEPPLLTSSCFSEKNDKKEKAKISLKNLTVVSEFDKNSTPIIKNLSFEVVPGLLTVIVGPVGSGKSSVLLSILNEMPKSSGSIDVTGSLIYVSQEAVIFAGTVRENILFGRDYNERRYLEAIKYSALEADLKQFEQGDLSFVDDRGTSLSGGQRARISLARALYANADCYLLDDPLSAVDAAVAKHIFEQCIKEYLSTKVVILVTHQLQFAKSAAQICVLKEGAALAVGSYTDLLKAGVDVYKYAHVPTQVAVESSEVGSAHVDFPLSSPSLKAAISTQGSFSSTSASVSAHQVPFRVRMNSLTSDIYRASRTTSFTSYVSDDDYSPSTPDQTSLFEIIESKRDLTEFGGTSITAKTGNIETNVQSSSEVSAYSKRTKVVPTWRTLFAYVKAGAGPLLLGTFLVSNFATQILFTGTDYWLSAWTGYQEQLHINASTPNGNFTITRNPIISENETTNRLIYSAIIVGLFIFAILRTVSYFTICMRASVSLHNRIFSSLLQAPIGFFDRTAVGVIMNRVARDLGIIDDLLPPTGFEAIEILGNCLGIFILCTALNYFVAIPLVFLVVFIVLGTRFYVTTARKVKRLEGVARSPLFNQMAATLGGLPTIRSYGAQEIFIERFSEKQNIHTSAYFTFISLSRFFGVYLELLCFIYIFCLIAYMNVRLEDYNGSIIGLTISQSLMLTDAFNWGVRQYCEVENYMTSVERVVEFGRLDCEVLDSPNSDEQPPPEWPTSGELTFDHVNLTYSDPATKLSDPKYVLRDLTFRIRAGEKVGIVGRTGAGKSSLITTLFRLTAPTGTITLDGVDTASVSLARLRQSLSIIPQEPVLFSGSVRRNLDPFGAMTDEQLWDALEKVQLRAKVAALSARLDSLVSAGGEAGGVDFSVGEKQLVCLARAILRRSPVLILDEATANVDPRTDAFIQATIRSELVEADEGRSPTTVLTIAHRLNTVVEGYDRVMVLDAGRLVQFDTPLALIERGEGVFYELYNALQTDVKAELRASAERAAMISENRWKASNE